MGLLDQLFAEDPIRAGINVNKSISAKTRTLVGAIAATAEAINGGFNVGERLPNASASGLSELRDAVGSVDATDIYSRVRIYREAMTVADQFGPLNEKNVADYVLSGGIKKGTHCIIQVVGQQKAITKSSIKSMFERKHSQKSSNLVFDKFSVESINEPDEEKYQILETQAADFIYTFGRRPRIFILSGTVLNGQANIVLGVSREFPQGRSFSMDWKNALQRSYDEHFRGSELTKQGNKIVISLQDTVYTGYLLNLITNTSAMNQAVSQVTMTFVLKSKAYIARADGDIPGAISNGFVIPSTLTPAHLFPEPALEQFFKRDILTDLNRDLTKLKASTTPKLAELSKLVGVTPAEMKSTFDDWIAGGTLGVPVPLWRELTLHPVMNAYPFKSGLQKDADDFDRRWNELNEDTLRYSTTDGMIDLFIRVYTGFEDEAAYVDRAVTISGNGGKFLPPVNKSSLSTLLDQAYSKDSVVGYVFRTTDYQPTLSTPEAVIVSEDWDSYISYLQNEYDRIQADFSTFYILSSAMHDLVSEFNALANELASDMKKQKALEDHIAYVKSKVGST